MFTSKIFLQSSAAAASCAACVWLTSYIYKSMSANSSFNYFLVDANSNHTITKKKHGTLFTNKQKNYICGSALSFYDYDCELFKLSSDSTNNSIVNKSIDLQYFFSNQSLLKGEVKSQKYILKLSKKYLLSNPFKSPIFLKSLKNPKNSFASLTHNEELIISDQTIKSTFATVKYVVGENPPNTFPSNKEYLCDIGQHLAVPCKLTAFEKIPHFYTFENKWVVPITEAIKLHQYFLLEIVDKNNEKTSAQFKESRIRIVEKDNVQTSIGTFEFEQLILKHKKTKWRYFPIVETKSWLVTIATDSASNATDPLITSQTWDKNYKCKVFGKNKEIDCNLYSLNYSATKKSSSFLNTKYWQKEVMTKSELTSDTFFKLKVNSEDLQTIKLDGSETIQLINKASKVVYATLSPKFEVKLNHIYGNTNLAFGKFETTLTGNGTTFKCKLSDTTEAEVCDIYKFTGTSKPLIETIFSTMQKVTNANELAATTNFVLDLKDQKLITTNNEQAISITIETEPSKTAQFAVETPLIAFISSTQTNNKIIYLQ